jgi:hypothetical protein
MKLCGGCSGCDSELYWSEWYNDPPRCCDPCDCHGNWTGPGPSTGCGCCNGGSACNCGCNDCYGSANHGGSGPYYTANRPTRGNQSAAVATRTRTNGQVNIPKQASNRQPNPYTQQRVARAQQKAVFQGTQQR